MSIRVVRALAALTLSLALVPLAYASSPQFWTVATQRDFLKGELHDLSIDGYGRLILGPTTSMVYEANSPFLWSIVAAPDGTILRGQRERRQGLPDRPQGDDQPPVRRHRARSARAGGGPRRNALRRHVTRRTHLQGEQERHGHALLQAGREVHLGPHGRARRGHLRRHRRTRRHLPHYARRQGLRLLQDPGGPRDGAGLRCRRRFGGRHLLARPRPAD